MTPTTRATNSPRAIKNGYDIAIVGAGAAGVAAAVSARRAADAAGKSASIILLEMSSHFGGSVTAAMHRSMCGLYASAPRDPVDTLNDGVQREVVRRMIQKEPGTVRPKEMGKAWVLEFPTPQWEAVLSELAAGSGADTQLTTMVTEARREENRISALKLVQLAPARGQGNPPRKWVGVSSQYIETKLVVDCTGGGQLLKLVGEKAYQTPEKPQDRMLAGFAIRLASISGDPELLRLQIPYCLAKAVQENALPTNARFTSFHPGPGADEGVCKLAINLTDSTTADAEALASRVLEHLKTELPAFSAAKIIEESFSILPRDGLRLRGRFTLSEQDVWESRQFGQESVRAWWPIERWDPTEGPTYSYPEVGRPYDIPPEALRSEAVDNLLAAGTCLSATALAAASSRASGICLATGDAAGRLAVTLLPTQ
jgi:hypothetical protein